VALLDIRGKHVGAPVYELLTGRTRDKVCALAVLSSDRPEAVAQARSAGFLAFSVPLSIPTGPTRGRTFYSDTFERVSRLRRDAEDFALDCGGRTSPAEAAALATKFESFHLLWMDEPAADMNDEALRKISDNTVTPLGWGRSMPDPGALQDLLRLQVVDVFRPDITLMGLSRARRGSALAEAYYTAVAPYQRYGPISTAAAIQLAAAVPNCFAVDVPIPAGERGRSMRADLGGDELERPSDGFLELPQGPGLGIEVDEGALRKYAAA
jgi:galactonate dehydratase